MTIRPLAGTRRRGADKVEDDALEAELLADPKERAEHLMLLDLGRNDVGRVSEIGSVKVVESFAIERFSHVMHISSTVEGRIRPDHDALDALVRATVHAGFAMVLSAARSRHARATILEQGEFLRRLGVEARANALARARPERAASIARQLARLIDPNEMGRLFKAVCLYKAIDPPPPGFEDIA